MAISLTPAAAERVKTFIASRGKGLGLRLGVRKTGCSGFAYVVNYADDAQARDLVFEDHGVKVFVDPESLPLINGTTVDFVKQGLNEAFRFHNPNIKGECGCGEVVQRLDFQTIVRRLRATSENGAEAAPYMRPGNS